MKFGCCEKCVFRESDVCDSCEEADQFEVDIDTVPFEEDDEPEDLRALPLDLEPA